MKPNKIIKVSNEHIFDNERWLENLDFTNVDEVAVGFAAWLNLYFEPWAPNHGTWIDMNRYAFTTEELYEEFIKEYKL